MPFRKTLAAIICLAVLALAPAALAAPALFQVNTIDALLAGVYDGPYSYADLAKRGDFGLGTFNRLDGEMIALDGAFYQIKSDGKVYKVSPGQKTPFANVTSFKATGSLSLAGPMTYEQLKARLDKEIPTPNLFYAVKITGGFPRLKLRSVPAQKKPYPPLVQAVKHQSVFNYGNLKGTLVGFRCPAFVKGVNVPGYHMHFIDDSRSKGGHVLDLTLDGAKVELMVMDRFELALPTSEAFGRSDLGADRSRELEKVEK